MLALGLGFLLLQGLPWRPLGLLVSPLAILACCHPSQHRIGQEQRQC